MNFLSLWNGWLCHQQSFYTIMSNNKRTVSMHACNWDAPGTFGSMGMGFSNGSAGKESTCNEGETGDTGLIPGSGRSPGGRYATHSSILPWKNPWREEPGGYNPKGSQRVRHNWTTKHSTQYLYGKLFIVGGLLCCCWGVLIITSQVIKIFATTQFKILYMTIISKGLSLFPPALPHAKSLQLCLTLCDPMDCSPPNSSVHEILQTRILEWGCHALLPGIFWTQELNPCLSSLLCWQEGSLPLSPTGKPCSVKWQRNFSYKSLEVRVWVEADWTPCSHLPWSNRALGPQSFCINPPHPHTVFHWILSFDSTHNF